MEGMLWNSYGNGNMVSQRIVECVKSCKLIMGSGKAIPSEPPSLASPRQGERGGVEGVASIPLVDLSEAQAAVFSLSRCASFRNAMLR
jgi:hypothetical protein